MAVKGWGRNENRQKKKQQQHENQPKPRYAFIGSRRSHRNIQPVSFFFRFFFPPWGDQPVDRVSFDFFFLFFLRPDLRLHKPFFGVFIVFFFSSHNVRRGPPFNQFFLVFFFFFFYWVTFHFFLSVARRWVVTVPHWRATRYLFRNFFSNWHWQELYVFFFVDGRIHLLRMNDQKNVERRL